MMHDIAISFGLAKTMMINKLAMSYVCDGESPF